MKSILGILLVLGMIGCGSTGNTGDTGDNGTNGVNGVNGQDGLDGQDGDDLNITILVNQPEPEPAAYYDLNTGVSSILITLDETGSGTVNLEYSVINNGGDNNFLFSHYVDGTRVDYDVPDEFSQVGSSRVNFVNEFFLNTNLTDKNITHKFDVMYDLYDENDTYVRKTFIAGTIIQEPFQLGLTDEELVQLIETTIEDSIGDIEIIVESPECVVCDNNETKPEPK